MDGERDGALGALNRVIGIDGAVVGLPVEVEDSGAVDIDGFAGGHRVQTTCDGKLGVDARLGDTIELDVIGVQGIDGVVVVHHHVDFVLGGESDGWGVSRLNQGEGRLPNSVEQHSGYAGSIEREEQGVFARAGQRGRKRDGHGADFSQVAGAWRATNTIGNVEVVAIVQRGDGGCGAHERNCCLSRLRGADGLCAEIKIRLDGIGVGGSRAR